MASAWCILRPVLFFFVSYSAKDAGLLKKKEGKHKKQKRISSLTLISKNDANVCFSQRYHKTPTREGGRGGRGEVMR